MEQEEIKKEKRRAYYQKVKNDPKHKEDNARRRQEYHQRHKDEAKYQERHNQLRRESYERRKEAEQKRSREYYNENRERILEEKRVKREKKSETE
jgi:hypothetical protein